MTGATVYVGVCLGSCLACAGSPPIPLRATAPVSEAAATVIRGEAPRSRLVVVLSIDQFRGDYLPRLADLFLPAESEGKVGGFRYLTSQGAYFANAHFEHFPLFTGPGHAVILTGAQPYKTGIVSNDWWDSLHHHAVYCVDDDRYTVVGASDGSKAKPMGPLNLRSSTVGDELKLATAGKAKVVTIGIKDRAAILLGGHAQDVSIWYDSTDGRWISSSAFCRGGRLPEWVESINSQHVPDRVLGTDWKPSLDPGVLAGRTIRPKYSGKDIPAGFGTEFPHHLGAEKTKANYRAFPLMPAANAFVFASAERAVLAEQLGQDSTPDILALNFSTNDYVGHAFGPYSPESVEITVETDRQLSEFLNFLATTVPDGLKSVLIVLTGDHGASPIPEDAASPPFGMSAGRYSVEAVVSTIRQALNSRIGDAGGREWFAEDAEKKQSGAFMDGFVYLNPEAIEWAISSGHAHTRRDIEQAACDAVNRANIPGVYGCYGKTQILEGAIADNALRLHLANAVHPQISSDLIVLGDQMYLDDPSPGGHATSHGTPFAYDTHVPLILCAPGLIRPGVYVDRVAPSAVAPTLSLLLGIEYPSGCDGQPLSQALVGP